MGQGAYEDDLVKVGEEWKIRHRRVVNDYLVADPTITVSLADPDVAALVQNLATPPTRSPAAPIQRQRPADRGCDFSIKDSPLVQDGETTIFQLHAVLFPGLQSRARL
jgi:hypothetical protein